MQSFANPPPKEPNTSISELRPQNIKSILSTFLGMNSNTTHGRIQVLDVDDDVEDVLTQAMCL